MGEDGDVAINNILERATCVVVLWFCLALTLESLSLASATGLIYLWNNLGLLLGEDVLVLVVHAFVIVMMVG